MAKIYLKKVKKVEYSYKNCDECYYYFSKKRCPENEKGKLICIEEDIIFQQVFPKKLDMKK